MTTWAVERYGALTVLAFSRPPDNLVDFASMIELGDLLEGFAIRTDRVNVVMLTSAVDDVFIDHAELFDLARVAEGRVTPQEAESWARALRLLEDIPQPTVAAIDGLASGGGNELALCCTVRIGSERARLQQPEITVGLIPGVGGSVRLPRLVGTGIAAEALLTGRVYSAAEALRVGWINALLPAEGFNGHARHWAATIARNTAPALAAAKKSIVAGGRLPYPNAISLEHELFAHLAATSNTLKAVGHT
jgi:enoyl-CoA hydratase